MCMYKNESGPLTAAIGSFYTCEKAGLKKWMGGDIMKVQLKFSKCSTDQRSKFACVMLTDLSALGLKHQ